MSRKKRLLYSDPAGLERLYWETHGDELPAHGSRKPNADEQAGDCGDDPEPEPWPRAGRSARRRCELDPSS